jgi:hypothetical protein
MCSPGPGQRLPPHVQPGSRSEAATSPDLGIQVEQRLLPAWISSQVLKQAACPFIRCYYMAPSLNCIMLLSILLL